MGNLRDKLRFVYGEIIEIGDNKAYAYLRDDMYRLISNTGVGTDITFYEYKYNAQIPRILIITSIMSDYSVVDLETLTVINRDALGVTLGLGSDIMIRGVHSDVTVYDGSTIEVKKKDVRYIEVHMALNMYSYFDEKNAGKVLANSDFTEAITGVFYDILEIPGIPDALLAYEKSGSGAYTILEPLTRKQYTREEYFDAIIEVERGTGNRQYLLKGKQVYYTMNTMTLIQRSSLEELTYDMGKNKFEINQNRAAQ